MKPFAYLTLALTVAFVCVSCGPQRTPEEAREYYKDILGYWSMGLVDSSGYHPGSYRLININDDGELNIAIHAEDGPMGFMHVDNTNISYEDGHLEFWDEMSGDISEDKNSIPLVYHDVNGTAVHFRMERLSDSTMISLLQSMYACQPTKYSYNIPQLVNDGLNTSSLRAEGMDEGKIGAMVERVFDGDYQDLHALLILKNDKLVLEEYFGGSGALHGPAIAAWLANQPHDLASVTKSVQSALLGVAIDSGLVPGVSTKLSTLLPDYADILTGKKSSLTLEHMLCMHSGLDWNELDVSLESADNDIWKMGVAADPVRYALEKPVVADPGTEFSYNTGNFIVIREILQRSIGMPVKEYASRALFNRMQITEFNWDQDNAPQLCARDLAKIGLLYLHDGRWNGEQLISEKWVRESLLNHQQRRQRHYGYQWWLKDFTVEGNHYVSFYAIGLGGNFLMVIPSLDLIIVTLARNYDSGWSKRFYSMVEDYIIPATQS